MLDFCLVGFYLLGSYLVGFYLVGFLLCGVLSGRSLSVAMLSSNSVAAVPGLVVLTGPSHTPLRLRLLKLYRRSHRSST